MKKQLLILITFCISIIGHSQTFTENYITYSITSTSPNTVAVIDYNLSGGLDVVIPATVTETASSKTSSIKGENSVMTTYAVTGIGYQAFFNKGITSVIIPNSVVSIGTEAFYNNLLSSVILPDGLTAINQSCFFNNQLTSITIPDSVLTIGTQAFSVNFLTSAIIGNNVTSIGFNAFYNNNLTSITIPNSVTTIEVRAFDDNLLTSVIIGNSVTTIGDNAFRDNPLTCVSSLAITPPTITTGANDSFGTNRSNINLTLPTGTTAPYVSDAGALWTGFNTVNEASGNTFVADNITYQITSTVNNTVKATDYSTAGGTVVNIPSTVTSACIIYSVTSIGFAAFGNKNLNSVTIPDSVIDVDFLSFTNNPQLTNLSLGNGLTTIGKEAFQNCNLPNLVIPNSVINIGDGAFVNNNNMSSVTIGNSVQSIGEYAFRFNNLNSVTIPDSVTSIGQLAFSSNVISTLVIGNGLTSLSKDVFSFNNISNLVIPDNIITISENAFSSNQNMSSLIIGNNVTTIGDLAFTANASQISNIVIPASVTSIGENAFAIPSLTDVTTLATTPPTIITGGSIDTFNAYRSNIHLHIPPGTSGVYVTDAGALWTGFNPVTEDASLSTSNFELAHDIRIISSVDKVEVMHSSSIELQHYSVYSISGAKIKEGKENIINVNTLSNGIYILELVFNEGRIAKKFVK